MVKICMIFIGAALLIFQVASAPTNDTSKGLSRGYVTIGGKEYYIEYGIRTRADAIFMCEFRNMKLISFDEPNQYQTISDWLISTGSEFDYFWTSGFSGKGSTTWTWESTGQTITNFIWGFNQPTFAPGQIDTYLCFRPSDGGWDDVDSANYVLSSICE